MEFKVLGGAREVGRSSVHVSTSESDILVDCGLKQGETTEYPRVNELDNLDAVVLTHAHIDHSGGLPLLSSLELLDGDVPVFCTPPTGMLLKTLLYDSYSLQRKEWKRNDRDPIYGHEDVAEVLKQVEPVPYQEFSVTDDIQAEFGNAGHILGSAWVQIRSEGRRVLFSGDLGGGRTNHLPRPADPPKSDALFLESTYGATQQHPSFSKQCNELIDAASAEVPVLIPSFAVGRAHEVLRLIKTRDEIDPSRVYFDGMIEETLPAYRSYASTLYMSESIVNSIESSSDPRPFLPEGVEKPDTYRDRTRIAREEDAPIVIAPSGMLTGGWSPLYLREFAESREDAKVILVGHQAEQSVGRRLESAHEAGTDADVTVEALAGPGDAEDAEDFEYRESEVRVPGEWIETFGGFSAHGSATSLLNFARKSLPRRIFVVHGDGDNWKSMEALLKSDSTLKHGRIESPAVGDEFELEARIPKPFEERLEELEEKVSELTR
ncbi:hypothetical protein AKJ40_03165 [candidate division MSBL1 archaeon SCGC-AAA259M10]|uniref:Metallo-beta-lactamase domain-containing protein n=2 Tax=candidate division MSBL1 TaxID=215777 RepID=A0A133V5T2_9EURY|nr:hypothetical protein AKJ40_03165 [candidate division MSBL1 archaeon SCGC-AAA259M10]KXB01802.1 hypothetical protein AKJ41_00030 [candidate division MSBL1 archaeon SCGC-AAA259O05]